MNDHPIPTATYRLQFNRDFTLDDALGIIPYLHSLGISHVYASPLLRARAGSLHGYDIVDHNSINPEIGDQASFDTFVTTLHQQGMGLILDIVPNHMGVGGDDNAWWLDVLENGEASQYARYFDIDWHPVNPALRNRVLLPFLGDHYGTVLEQGELRLGFDAGSGTFSVRYFEHLFPIDPRSYAWILTADTTTRQQPSGYGDTALEELAVLVTDLKSLPRRSALSSTQRQRRVQDAAACKQRLAELYRRWPGIQSLIDAQVQHFNGTAGQPHSFDLLHRLLEGQAYRLAYWRVAADEINYRRFFDINELAGIRIDNHEVFQATHRLIRQLISDVRINGLRIDHPDGLSDPFGYYCDLQALIREAHADAGTCCLLLVEKVLARHEHLPDDWPVAGTTGYEAASLLNGLFIDPAAETALDRLFTRYYGNRVNFEELLYERKLFVIHNLLASELTVLANRLSRIARADRRTRDFTYYGLRNALSEVVARFPVYRTYITAARISDTDRRYVQWAVVQAKQRSRAADAAIFDFIHELLMLAHLDEYSPNNRRRIILFTLHFQQYTAPVMAKGMEDTTFYVYNRLLSLNDVGFDPRSFATTCSAFHHENRQRLATWPAALVSTSTHDSKRGEDVRARINVLTEVADEWRQHLSRWSRINRGKKRLRNNQRMPSRNDEYLLYQTLVGSWPLGSQDAPGLAAYCNRIEEYMLKAVREAKVHTSWTRPDEEYEQALLHFVRALLEAAEHNAFLADFIPFQQRIVRFGLLNSLSQTLLKLTVPGVPDTYQGNELWAFNLVDPDNRRTVDYAYRQVALQALTSAAGGNEVGLCTLLQQLLARIENGHAKLYLTWRTLALRRQHPRLFSDGEYLALEAEGPAADHICAFARCFEDDEIVVAAPRWFVRLAGKRTQLPLGSPVWDGTRVQAPDGSQLQHYRNVLTDESVQSIRQGDSNWLMAAQLFARFPVVLLYRG